ncbi:TonB-dependent receptor [Catalinimonas niigatensis]|uniref:TonB-dependent receptor n=1 Tax=Catalinimonas niigatensis TaxID=1397264 RepID=UPI002665208E|nr:TonB-dependent receptor [Catalinimonas niigatensis]WPP52731.1 TonB-dependent receptor [Catalinimonas niigatensis]
MNIQGFAQEKASIFGSVNTDKAAVPGVTVQIVGTQQGTVTDEQGKYRLNKVPSGKLSLRFQSVGFRTLEKTVEITAETATELNITLSEDLLSLNEVVVSGTRTARSRSDLPVAVDLISSKTFEITQSLCLAEGLNFQPGLRTETDCQTCNYTQVRMNGMGGAYTQILINSRPIFSALTGLYGLEQIPANMIKQVEIVRGGGSALYGSSAIAGTINVITQDPQENGFGISLNQARIDGQSNDQVINVNGSIINEDKTAGVTLFASRRRRQAYDANGDGFSEIPFITNQSFGLQTFIKPNEKSHLGLALNSIQEGREGGDQLDLPPHKRLQSESRNTNIISGNIDFTRALDNINSSLSIYSGVQRTDRTHYTGFLDSDGYGTTDNTTFQSGFQYNFKPARFPGVSQEFTVGAEFQYDDVLDEIAAYNYLIDQTTRQWGIFLQSEWQLIPAFTVLAGARLNRHNLMENWVLTPRLSLMYEPLPDLKFRTSYANGFRAPQAFDADMHIAFAGGGIALINIDPDLQPEYSDSFSASADFDNPQEHYIYGFTLSAFHTRLYDTFILEETNSDAEGNTILQKLNGGNSTVQGITLEGRMSLDEKIELDMGMTFQQSLYDEAVAWSTEVESSRTYLRTPNQYGYYTLAIMPAKAVTFSLSGVYTGPMLVPHFGGAPGVDGDRLHTSQKFLETNLKLAYQFTLKDLQQDIQLFGGVQNLFNEYQSDFDIGPDRDSNYVYGPARPRTIYAGIKFGRF